jgi:tellurite resistance protein
MSTSTQTLSDLLNASDASRRDGALVDASMAAAALVSMADGSVSFTKRALVDQAVDALADRCAASPDAAIIIFQEFVDGLRDNSNPGRQPAFAALRVPEAAGEAATVVLRVAEAVAVADGEATAAEIAAVQGIAPALNTLPDDV